MKPFSLDIERYYQSQKVSGLSLSAITVLQYPVYCIHTRIIDSTPDPLEKLDRYIITNLLNNVDTTEIGSLVSVEHRIIKSRITSLVDENLLELTDNKYTLTKEGKRIFIEGSQQRLIPKSYDFYIDGISFEPLPAYFYKGQRRVLFLSEDEIRFYTGKNGQQKSIKEFQPDICHTPPSEKLIWDKIVKTQERKEFNIPEGLQEITASTFTKLSYPVLIAHLYDKSSNSIKKLFDGYNSSGDDVYCSVFLRNTKDRIKNKAIEILGMYDKSKDETRYHLITNWNEIDNSNVTGCSVNCSITDLLNLLKNVYGLDLREENILLGKTKIKVNITRKSFDRSRRKLKILENVKRGRDYIYGNSDRFGVWLLFVDFASDDQYILDLVKIKDEIGTSAGFEMVESILKRYPYPYREVLVSLERFDLLEAINMKKFMNIENE